MDCASWSKGELETRSRGYPCDTCSAPGVPIGEFLFALFGTTQFDEPLKGERALRKWMNSKAPMHADDFRRVLAQAFVHGWLNKSQVLTLWGSVLELEAASSTLRRVLKQARRASSGQRSEDSARTLTLQIEKEIAMSRDRLSERTKKSIATWHSQLTTNDEELTIRSRPSLASRGGPEGYTSCIRPPRQDGEL